MHDTSREYPKHPIPGVAATIIHENRILLALRGKPPSQGMWGLPGGVVEVGETLEEAVVREIKEETSVDVEPIKLITIFDTIRRDKEGRIKTHFILFEYLCKYLGGEVKAASDAPDARWISLDALDSIDIMHSTRRFIQKTLKTHEGILRNYQMVNNNT